MGRTHQSRFLTRDDMEDLCSLLLLSHWEQHAIRYMPFVKCCAALCNIQNARKQRQKRTTIFPPKLLANRRVRHMQDKNHSQFAVPHSVSRFLLRNVLTLIPVHPHSTSVLTEPWEEVRGLGNGEMGAVVTSDGPSSGPFLSPPIEKTNRRGAVQIHDYISGLGYTLRD